MPGNPARGMLGDYLRAVQLKQQHEQFQQQHDLAQKQLDELHNYHQGELDRMQHELDFNKAKTAQDLKNHMIEQIASGVQQPPDESSLINPSTQYGVGQQTIQPDQSQPPSATNIPQQQTTVQPTGVQSQGYKFNLSPEDLSGIASALSPAERQISVSSPERMSQLEASSAGQKQAAIVAANAPEREAERELKLNEAFIAANQRAKTAEENNATRRYVGEMNADARRYAADHNAANKTKISDEELGNSASDVALGIADMPTGANGIHVQSILHQRNEVPFGKKNGGDKLDSLNDLDGLFQDMSDASKELPSKAKTVAGLPGQVAGQTFGVIKGHLPITTSFKNKMAAVDARSPEVVRNVFGIGSGRITNTEINKATQALVSGGMTQEDAQENINKLRRDAYTKVYSDILGAMPTTQKVAVLAQHGGLDRWRNIAINYKGQTIPVIRKMANGREAMFNTNTGQYEGIEDLK